MTAVRRTGNAEAHDGGIAVTGYVGTLNYTAVAKPRSHYLERVRQIAPERLLGREAERAALAAFCTAGDPGPAYLQWRAPAWAGKSALMSWLVLEPPAGARVVSFFVTARWAGQNDRVAFAEVLIEQLAELLDEPLPPLLSESTRESHLLGMLGRAAEMCRTRGERLILVVDGLDEDRGVTAGDDAHSIAALLPARPPAGMRIVVSGRPHPPVPADVPEDHPLQDPSVVRVLTASPHAVVLRHDAQRELKRLLNGSGTERDLLGLLAAAGGGLSARDLAELTGSTTYDVDDLLTAVSARTFAAATARWRRGTTVYVLGHEELQQQAVARLGDGLLAAYRERLHAWADGYRDRGWPEHTPEYLLRGYFALVQATGDTSRMVSLASDTGRHDRMLDITGGDAEAVLEVAAAVHTVTTQDSVGAPDLARLLVLSHHRSRLEDRNSRMPTELPALWTTLGQPVRGEALALGIPGPEDRVRALAALVDVVAGRPDRSQARALTDVVVQTSPSVRDGERRVVLSAMTLSLVRAGLLDEAEATARAVAGEDTGPLATVVSALVEAGEVARAGELAHAAGEPWSLVGLVRSLGEAGDLIEAGRVTETIADPESRLHAWAVLVEALGAAGDRTGVRALADRAEHIARTGLEGRRRSSALETLAVALCRAGDPARAAEVAGAVAEPDSGSVRARMAEVLCEAGELSWAQRVIDDLPSGNVQLTARMALSRAYRERDDLPRALAALQDAGDHPSEHTIPALAVCWMRAGDFRRAMRIALAAAEPAEALFRLARVALSTGDHPRARALATRAEHLAGSGDERAFTLVRLARVQLDAGDAPAARALAARAAEAIPEVTGDEEWGGTAAESIRVCADAGDFDLAVRLVDGFTRGRLKWEARRALIEKLVQAGDIARIERLAQAATDRYDRARIRAELVTAVVKAGDLSRAREVAADIGDPFLRAQSLTEVGRAFVTAGHPSEAQLLAVQAEQAARAITSPETLGPELVILSDALIEAGESPRAVLEAALRVAQEIDDHDLRTEVMTSVVTALGRGGHSARAQEVAAALGATALLALAETLVAAGDLPAAEQVARAIVPASERARALSAVAAAAPTRARELAREAADRALEVTGAKARAATLVRCAETLLAVGDQARVRALGEALVAAASAITSQYRQAVTLMRVARILVEAGDLSRAESATRLIADRNAHPAAQLHLARAAAEAGHLAEAERMARAVADPGFRAEALGALATAMAAAGRLPVLPDSAPVLIAAARAAATAGDRAEVLVLAQRAAPDAGAEEQVEIVEILAGAGHPDAAVAVAEQGIREAATISSAAFRARQLCSFIPALSRLGQAHLVHEAAGHIPAAEARLQVLIALIEHGELSPTRRAEVARLARASGDPAALLALAAAVGPPGAGPLLATALAMTPWRIALPEVASLYPAAVTPLAGAVLCRPDVGSATESTVDRRAE
ncbi:hypothetical protein ACFY36_03785 [Actinoplanes sp. NPDC000266]